MTGTWQQRLQSFLGLWADLSIRYSKLVIIIAVITSVLSGYYTITHISINTDTADMLSPDLDWRKQDALIDRLFPQFTDNLLVVIEAETPDEASDAAMSLYKKLKTDKKMFTSVFYPAGDEFFQTSSLLFLDVDELQDLSDNLARIQPFLGRLTSDQSLRGFFNMLNDAVKAKSDGSDIDLGTLTQRIDKGFQAVANNSYYRLSWQALIGGKQPNKSVYREFIVLQANLDYGGLQPAAQAIDRIHQMSSELHLDSNHHIKVRLTGNVAMSEDELTSVFKGMEFSVAASLTLVTILLILGLRSGWHVCATLLSLLCGLLYTACFAAFAIGELNLISVAFAVLYIGLGVDFAIHFCLHYQDELAVVTDKKSALIETGKLCGEALLLCAITTIIGFYAFIPTDYVGVAELGKISGTGMIISFIVTMTLLPALLVHLPVHKKIKNRKAINPLVSNFFRIPITWFKPIRLVTVLLMIAAVIITTRIGFDHNTLNLKSPDSESVKTFFDLLADKDTSPWTSVVLADNKQQAKSLANRLSQLKLVDKVVWLDDLVPKNQDEKLAIIEQMDLLLGGLSVERGQQAPALSEQIQSIVDFNNTLGSYIKHGKANADDINLHETISGFLQKLSSVDVDRQQLLVNHLQATLLQSFPGRLNSLLQAMYAEPVSEKTIPADITSRWKSQGKYRLEIYPTEDLSNNSAMRRFVNEIRTVAPNAIGAPIINIEAGDAVIKAFVQAFSYALAAIIVLLLVLTKRKRDALYILMPLIIATFFTGAISVLLGIHLNFANIIALPLLLGIGVDSAIHIVHKYNASPDNDNLLGSSSARAVLLSALTTILSIGNLAFSPHPGTASMGALLTIGISMTLLCSLVILPAILVNKPRS